MRGIDGKTAIVTGGATGIGAASARRFAEEGASVVVADVNVEGGEGTVESIRDDGGEATFVEADVSESSDVEALLSETVEAYGPPDVAHNNAGVNSAGLPTHEVSESEWDRTVGINQRGVWLCMRAELRLMLENGGGAIVNTASLAGLWASEMAAPYGASKHGVVGLTRTAAVEYADRGVRVNALCPGLTDTPMAEGSLEPGIAITAMRRAADPAEQAAMAVWLCSEEASFVTGVALPVDGGSVNGRA